MIDLMVCIRFSAWSNTMDWLDSNTSSVTSSSSSPVAAKTTAVEGGPTGTGKMSGGSTAVFVYLYCFIFLVSESKMSGLLQLSFYFGYMGMLCYAVFLMLGAVGFYASLTFVRQIYKSIKCD